MPHGYTEFIEQSPQNNYHFIVLLCNWLRDIYANEMAVRSLLLNYDTTVTLPLVYDVENISVTSYLYQSSTFAGTLSPISGGDTRGLETVSLRNVYFKH